MTHPRLEALAFPLRDLSRWNRLLSMSSDRRSGYLSFVDPVSTVWAALSPSAAVSFGDPVLRCRDDWSSQTPIELDAQTRQVRLTRLLRDALSVSDETGVSPLSLALGLVLWRDGKRVRVAPLMHCPVTVEGGAGAETLRRSGMPVLNPLLVERLGIKADALPVDPLTWEDSHLAEYGVIAIVRVAVLGLFDLARYRQWQWLMSGVELSGPGSEAVARLLAGLVKDRWPQKPVEPATRDGESREILVDLLDRSQMDVLMASRRGLDFVVQGGPGTGKTQTILHVIGNAIYYGRTVLFLAGRRSAFRAMMDRGRGKLPEGEFLDLCDPGLNQRGLAVRFEVEAGETVQATLAAVSERPRVLMATPANLALHMPRDWTFDLLIVDEASLIPLVEALSAVAACGQIVICGDSQQMQRDPPLHVLFDREVPYVPTPSLLDAALQAGLPDIWLYFHYRSRHPSLMHYTNRMFYDGAMRICPSPETDADLGFRAQRVEGIFSWETMTNAIEVEAVVDALARHIESGSAASVMIIAMTMQQRDLIRQRVVERDLDCASIEGRETLLIADYNGVQGEERDVVFISMTFGPREGDASWPTSYGAISLPGGEKRLNVIMTRSRERMVLMTSFPKESIDVGLTMGNAKLGGYLECAALPYRDEALRYEGPLEAILQCSSLRGAAFDNAVGVIDSTLR